MPDPGSASGPTPPAQPSAAPSVRRRSGVVVPHQAAWRQRLAARMVWALIRSLSATLRFRFPPSASALTQPGQPPVIFCTWHNRLALSLIIYERAIRRADPSRRLAAMVSASRDGGLLARILELFEVEPVRGSSSRRGPQALRELTTWAERGLDLAITPDGPRGPCYRIQDGVIAAAQLTGRAILPVVVNLSNKIRFRSWDRFQLPLPFARADVVVGPLLQIPRGAADHERAALRQQLEATMTAMTVD